MYLHTYSKKTVSSSISKLFLVGLLYCTAGLTYAQTKITAQGTISIGHRDDHKKNTATQFVQLQTNTGESYLFDLNKFKGKSNIQLNDLLNNQAKVTFSIPNDSSRTNGDLIDTINSITLIPILNKSKIKSTKNNEDYTKIGNFPYAILMCGYKDSPAFDSIIGENDVPVTKTSVLNMFIGDNRSVDYYWRQASFDKFTIAGTQSFGWYRMPYTKSQYQNNRKDKGEILFQIHCMNAATKDGFNSSAYHGIVFPNVLSDSYSFVRPGAGIPALLPDGCYGYPKDNATGKCILNLNQPVHTEIKVSMALSNNVFIGNQGRRDIVHEMGHTFGLNHSYFTDSTATEHLDYKNSFDIMSGLRSLSNNYYMDKRLLAQHTIGYNRYLLGWLDNDQISTYTLDDTPLTINLETASLTNKNKPRIILLNYKNRPLQYSVEVRGARNSMNEPNYFDNELTEPVIIIHRHKLIPNTDTTMVNRESSIVNPGKLKSDNSYTESVMLRQNESWIAAMHKPDTKRFKLTVNSINDTSANVTVETIN